MCMATAVRSMLAIRAAFLVLGSGISEALREGGGGTTA
jgi:hypothetical protein